MNRPPRNKLRRTLGLFALIARGVGDIPGAGIYALVGKMAGIAGPAVSLISASGTFALGFVLLFVGKSGQPQEEAEQPCRQ